MAGRKGKSHEETQATLWEASADVGKLAKKVRYYNRKYFVEHKSPIPDQKFDRLVEQLRELDPDNPALTELVEDSRVPSASSQTCTPETDDTKKARHDVPMLSIDKVFTADKVSYWASKAGAFGGRGAEDGLTASFKVDGSSCSLIYEDGKLAHAATRGDGKKGDDITSNAMTIGSIPESLPALGGKRAEIRGEIYMTFESFNAAVERFERDRKSGMANENERPENPRNFCAGSIKQKDPNITRERKLSFMAHTCVSPLPGTDGTTDVANFERLAELGFETPFYRHIGRPEDIEAVIKEMDSKRAGLPYPCDGVVFTINRLALHEELGSTPHHPRYKLAFKFSRDRGETIVRGIHWETSRNGRVCPTMEVDPIPLGGATVTYCTVHNADTVRSVGLHPGDRVLLEREVIPHFVRKATDVTLPESCPSCGSKLEWDDTETDLLCRNVGGCKAQLVDYLEHYVSRGVANIVGVGPEVITALVEDSLVRSPADFFDLTHDKVMACLNSARARKAEAKRPQETVTARPSKSKKSGGAKQAQNLIHAINSCREQTLETFLVGLGIRGMGPTVAAHLAEHFGTLEAILGASTDDLMCVERMPTPLANNIYSGLRDRKSLIKALLKHVSLKQAAKTEGPLTGKSFCLTGHVEFDYGGKHYDARPDIEDLIKSKGGTIKSVSKGLSYLVAGDGGGSKSEKARKAGIPIIDGLELVKMLE